jgi:hypothetical protein
MQFLHQTVLMSYLLTKLFTCISKIRHGQAKDRTDCKLSKKEIVCGKNWIYILLNLNFCRHGESSYLFQNVEIYKIQFTGNEKTAT